MQERILTYREKLNEFKALALVNSKSSRDREAYLSDLNKLIDTSIDDYNELVICKEAANLLINLKEEKWLGAIRFITETINETLKKMFPDDPREISIDTSTFRTSYPQLNVEVVNSRGYVNVAKFESTGVAQTISILYVLSLIFLSKKRNFVILDEVMDGLHDNAREILLELIHLLTEKRDFTVIICEHALKSDYIDKRFCLIKNDIKGSYLGSEDAYNSYIESLALMT